MWKEKEGLGMQRKWRMLSSPRKPAEARQRPGERGVKSDPDSDMHMGFGPTHGL